MVTGDRDQHRPDTTWGARRYRAFLGRLPREETASGVADIVEAGPLGVDPALKAALRALPETDAKLFALVALEGYPLTEAATVLGLTRRR